MKKGVLTTLFVAAVPMIMGLSASLDDSTNSENLKPPVKPIATLQTPFENTNKTNLEKKEKPVTSAALLEEVRKVIVNKTKAAAAAKAKTTPKPKPAPKVDKEALLAQKVENVPGFNPKDLYLINKAGKYVKHKDAFANKIKQMADKLQIPPEWIMGIIDSESGFNPRVNNKKGSGARGLLQFMPLTCKEFGYKKVPNSPLEQLDFCYKYLRSRQKHFGTFKSFTDVKLSVLYPVAVGKSSSFVLYSSPSTAYYQNSGLDMNKDGAITVSDIESYMRKNYGSLYNS